MKEIKKFSFWKTFLPTFLITLSLLGITFGFFGLYEEDFIEGFMGIVILTFPLAIIFNFFVKWWKDYKLTDKWLVLDYREIKWWQSLFVVLLLLFSAITILSAPSILNEEHEPSYQIEEWNPDGYYG